MARRKEEEVVVEVENLNLLVWREESKKKKNANMDDVNYGLFVARLARSIS